VSGSNVNPAMYFLLLTTLHKYQLY